MASFQKESGTAKGRGFGTVDGVPSLLNRLKTWIAKSAVSGGPAWFIIDDQSAISPLPYIVCSNVAAPTNANRGKVVRFGISSVSDTIDISFYMWWNTTTHVGYGQYAGYEINSQENTEYGYDFRGGPECLLLMTNIGGAWDWAFIDEWEGDANLVEADFDAALIQDYLVETGDTNNQINNYHLLTGVGPNLDANGKLYFSVVVAGANAIINVYKDSARTQLIGHTNNSSSTGSTAITADNSSGLGGSIGRSAIVSNDTGIEVDFRLYVGSGEGASFTVGKYYFIWDFAQSASRVNYFKVTAISGDILTVEGMTACAFNTGACLSPYAHRWFVYGNQVSSGWTRTAQIPYFSATLDTGLIALGQHFSTASSNITSASYTYLSALLDTLDPDDESKCLVMRPLVFEFRIRTTSTSDSPNANRAYGRLKNIYVSSPSGMAQMQFGRTINTKNYLTYSIEGSVAFLFLDTVALS